MRDGDDFAEGTGRNVYADLSICTIEGGRGTELVQLNLPRDVFYLRPSHAHGDVDRDGIVRRMIERTIRALKPHGIEVLSLFVIDRVDNYRVYCDDGRRTPGKYATTFEDSRRLARYSDFGSTLFAGIEPDAGRAHDGYFSIDKKGKPVEAELIAAGDFAMPSPRMMRSARSA